MIDREEVIKGLECCMSEKTCHGHCPYNGECEVGGYYYSKAIEDAIALLKAQEPIAPKSVVRGAIVQWRCGACDARLGDCLMGDIDNYCRHCGRAVKWNG